MKISTVLASGLLAVHAGGMILPQQNDVKYPRAFPKDITVTAKDGKSVSLQKEIEAGKTMIFFVANNCPMMPGKRLEDIANVEKTVRTEKLEKTRVIILMDEFENSEGKKYWAKNPAIKDVPAYRISSDDLMGKLDMTNANQNIIVQDGKILKMNPGTNTAIWKDALDWLCIKTSAEKMISDYGKRSFEEPQSGCIGIWKYRGGKSSPGMTSPRNQKLVLL